MSKVEIAGPKSLLMDTLAVIRDTGVFHVEPDYHSFIGETDEQLIRNLIPDEKILSEQLFCQNLLARIDELFALFPEVSVRDGAVEEDRAAVLAAGTIDNHLARQKELRGKSADMEKERSELARYASFLTSIEPLFEKVRGISNLEFIGVVVKDDDAAGHLKKLVSELTGGRFNLLTARAGDGSLVGLLTTARDVSEKVKKSLSDERVPELRFPAEFSELPFPEKIGWIQRRHSELAAGLEALNDERERFSAQWLGIYAAAREWLADRLNIITITTQVYETGMCFFIHGWIPARETPGMIATLKERLGESIVLEEKAIFEQDMNRIPVVLRNPAYFKPYELLTRILPVPAYTSYDPTPFIGIFFPLFFGMMLGDAGIGLILLAGSLWIALRHKRMDAIGDTARILFTCSVYSIVFGMVYGEFFGDLGERLTSLPGLVNRRTAILPMVYFAISAGLIHVVLGLLLGAASDVRLKERKSVLLKLLNIMLIICLAVIISGIVESPGSPVGKPMVIAAVILLLALMGAGGLLAPLELMKNIGNIVSYVRIMAIGLTSVFLAHVANSFAGTTGNIAAGVSMAVLLYIINIVIGVFSPAIHAIRLHYVEFFGKFMRYGGKKYEPLKKAEHR